MGNLHIFPFAGARTFSLLREAMMTRQFPILDAPALRYVLYGSAAFLLAIYAGPAEAAGGYTPGFWVGFEDGLLSLLKLMASPLADFTLVDSQADSWAYKVGYGLGVVTFAAAAGTAASSA
jgi:hypothetical protein